MARIKNLSPYTKEKAIEIMASYFGMKKVIAERELDRLLSAQQENTPKIIYQYECNLRSGKKSNVVNELITFYPFYQQNRDFIAKYVQELELKPQNVGHTSMLGRG